MYSITERWVNGACEGIMQDGQVRLYRDLYRDLRKHLPCGAACGLIVEGLRRTRRLPSGGVPPHAWVAQGARARAIAALMRLARWAEGR